jgi:NADH-quinone oxidoreductase subunit F
MEGLCEKIEHGHGVPGDVDKLLQMANNIGGQTICALGDAAAMPVQSFVKKFRAEFERHVTERRCPFGDEGWGKTQESREAVIGGMRA